MDDAVRQQIESYLASDRICLFMKGSKEQPMCGFSAQVVHILNSYGAKYTTVDVLQDWDLREGIKEYTQWPTIPQLYVDKKFVGGCDIISEMHRKGELAPLLN